MEQNITCKKEKERFFSYLGSLGLGALLLLLIAFLYFYNNYKKEKIYEAFVNNQELICKNNIVSKELAYEFDKKRAYQITNGVNIFTIYNCDIK